MENRVYWYLSPDIRVVATIRCVVHQALRGCSQFLWWFPGSIWYIELPYQILGHVVYIMASYRPRNPRLLNCVAGNLHKIIISCPTLLFWAKYVIGYIKWIPMKLLSHIPPSQLQFGVKGKPWYTWPHIMKPIKQFSLPVGSHDVNHMP